MGQSGRAVYRFADATAAVNYSGGPLDDARFGFETRKARTRIGVAVNPDLLT